MEGVKEKTKPNQTSKKFLNNTWKMLQNIKHNSRHSKIIENFSDKLQKNTDIYKFVNQS